MSALHLSSGARCVYLFFFFNDTATTEIYTLSLHDALPIFALHGLLVKVASQLLQLHLSLLVEFKLSSGGTTCLIQTVRQILEFVLQLIPLLLDLGSGGAFSL